MEDAQQVVPVEPVYGIDPHLTAVSTADLQPPARDALASLTTYLRFLASTDDGQAVAKALVLGALAPMGLVAGHLYAALDDEHLTLIGSHGFTDAELEGFRRIPLTLRLPLTNAFTSMRPFTTNGAEIVELFPLLGMPQVVGTDDWRFTASSLIAVPVIHQGVSIGVIGLALNSVLTLNADNAWYLDSVAAATALWLVRTLDTARMSVERRAAFDSTPLITARQRTVIEMVGQGFTNGEIAKQVGYSVPTIKKDLQYIMTLCDVHDRRQVYAVAKHVGLV
ncbi:MAG: response regulator transcription factor [Actinomycetales bacterium]